MMQSLEGNNKSVRFSKWLPTPGNVIFTLLVIGVLVWAQSTGAFPAPAPKAETAATSTGTIAYQGRLADVDGNPLTDTYPMVFRLYSAPGTGVYPLWEENWTGSNSVQVSDGLFNVMLGTLTPISQTIITQNSTLWLGISVGSDDEMIPRVQLGSVPFAVQANTVLNGSITTEKLVDGAVTSSKIANGTVAGADLTNNAVTAAKIADNAVGSSEIVANAVGSSEISNGAVTQIKAPTLVGSNLSNTQIQYGKVWITAAQDTDNLWIDIDFSPNFGSAPAFMLLPAVNNHWDVIPTYGHCDTSGDKCRAFFTQADGGSWAAGQFQEFSWIAIQQN